MGQMGKERSRKGFTLAEVLVAVVIVAVTLAVAVPVAIGGVRRMDLNRLDESARSIFLAAQNSLTAMVGNGELEGFAEGVTGNKVVDMISSTPGASGERAPSDFPKKTDPAGESTIDKAHGDPKDLRYLDSENDAHKDALKKLLPGGSIDKELAGHHYVVEYNCKTGAVYAVWYSDEEEIFNYDVSLDELRDYNKRVKKSPLIGYYGGSGVEYALVGQMPVPELTLTNAEELRLHIEMPGSPSTLTNHIGLEITIKGADSGVAKQIIKRGATTANAVILNEKQRADLILDTLKDSESSLPFNTGSGWEFRRQFSDWASNEWPEAGSGQLIPGEDISVTVTTYYVPGIGTAADEDKLYLPQSVTVSCNSLFARVEKKEGTNAAGEKVEIPTAMIEYGRHLQNLDVFTATGDPAGKIGTNGAFGIDKKGEEITAAEQIAPIDFAATAAAGVDKITFWKDTYPETPAGGTATVRKFTAIHNSALKSYDGHSLPIRNMEAVENSHLFTIRSDTYPLYNAVGAGLFADVIGAEGDEVSLKNITLINPTVTLIQQGGVGALAGYTFYVSISNCQAYLEKAYNPTDDATPHIEKQGNSLGFVGGFVGAVGGDDSSGTYGDTTITDSFASLMVVNEGSLSNNWKYCSTGGLVGWRAPGASVIVNHSYAACYLVGGQYVGGLIGYNSLYGRTTHVNNSYAAGIIANVNNNGNVGGLIGGGTGTVSITNVYTAVRYGEEVAKASLENKATVYPVASTGYGASFDQNLYYIPQAGVKYFKDGRNKAKAVTSTELSEMGAGALSASGYNAEEIWYTLPAEDLNATGTDMQNQNPSYAVFPYHQTDETATLAVNAPYYPYPILKTQDAAGNDMPMFHYGDWLEDYGPSLCYFEDYSDRETPRYGVWGYFSDGTGTQPIHSLKADVPDPDDPDVEHEIVADGYGLLVPQNAAGKTKCPGEIEVTGGTLMPINEPATAGSTPTPKVIQDVYLGADAPADQKYDLYPYTFVPETTAPGATPAVPATQYYHSVILFGQEYWFNFAYACEAVKAPTGVDIATAGPQAKPRAAGFAASILDTDANAHKDQVVVRTARQLANLANATGSSYENAATTPAEKESQQRTYVQLMDIDYSAYTGKVDDCPLYDINNDNHIDDYDTAATVTGKDNTHRQSPAALNSGSYDGNGFIIKNLYITSGNENDKEYAGLFGCTNGTFKNIYLVNVNVTGDRYVGALAGRFQGSATAANCGVYVDTSVANAYDEFTIKGTYERVGGLLGNVFSDDNPSAPPKLDGCFAAVKVEGTYRVGGLVGNFSANKGDCLIKDCYSGGHTDSGVYTAGGVNVTGKNYVGGLIGRIEGDTSSPHTVTLEGVNYSTCSVKATDSSPNIGLLIGYVNGATVTKDASTNYAIGAAFDSTGNPATPSGESTYLGTTFGTNTQTTFATCPYDETLKAKVAAGERYPYATNLVSHHGDWVEKSLEACFYWEKEGTGYNVYIVGFDGTDRLGAAAGTNHLGELCETQHTVEEAMDTAQNATSNTDWGYGTIGLTDGLGTTLPPGVTEITTAPGVTTKADVTAALKGALTGHSFDVATVTVYTGATTGNTVTNVSSVAASGQTYHLNLGFAAAIEVGTTSNLGSPGTPYQIRNVRQLDNIPGGVTANPDERCYEQTHDVYGGDSYTTYTSANYFAGKYDGGSYRILELKGAGQRGLFGNLVRNAMLEDIILYSPSGTATFSNSGAVGALAGDVGVTNEANTVTITNCAVAGYNLYNDGRGTLDGVGGFVGAVRGGTLTIQNCSAVNHLEKIDTSEGVGGLVGSVGGSGYGQRLNITNSYAGGTATGTAGHFGGLVGCSYGTVTYTNVYSYMDMRLADGKNATTPFYGIGPEADNNCYYLQNCLPLGKTASDSTATKQTIEELKNCMIDSTPGVYKGNFGEVIDATNSYPIDKATLTGPYPFPAVVKDANDNFVHYGNWPTSNYSGSGSPGLPGPSIGDPGIGGPEIFDDCICTTHCEAGAENKTCPVCSRNPAACAVKSGSDVSGGDAVGGDVSGNDVSGGDAPNGSGTPDGNGGYPSSPAALPPEPSRKVPAPGTSEPDSGSPGKEATSE